MSSSPQEPWPDSAAPDASVRARAVAVATRAMATTPGALAGPVTADYLGSGWSSHACFAVHANGQSVFAKATRTRQRADVDDLRNEFDAARWAHDAGLGPAAVLFAREEGVLIMEFLRGAALTAKAALQRLHDVVALLRRFHRAPVKSFRAPAFDFVLVAREQVRQALAKKLLSDAEASLIERVTRRACTALSLAPAFVPVVCHTDFHLQNIVLDEHERLFVVDCEEAGLADPMGDLGALTANMATMGSSEDMSALTLADAYGATDAQKLRLRSHFELALAAYAGWTALHGAPWQKQYQEAMRQLEKLE